MSAASEIAETAIVYPGTVVGEGCRILDYAVVGKQPTLSPRSTAAREELPPLAQLGEAPAQVRVHECAHVDPGQLGEVGAALSDPAELSEQGKQQLLLAREVQVDGAVGDPGLARDLAHRGPVEPLTGEDPAGRCQDLCPPPIDPLLCAH